MSTSTRLWHHRYITMYAGFSNPAPSPANLYLAIMADLQRISPDNARMRCGVVDLGGNGRFEDTNSAIDSDAFLEQVRASHAPSYWAYVPSIDENGKSIVSNSHEESIWLFTHNPDPIWCTSYSPYLRLSVNVERLDRNERARVELLCMHFVATVCSESGFAAGFVEAGNGFESSFGSVYDSELIGWSSFHRQLPYRVMVQESLENPHKCVGVFWGNIFGPQIVRLLGGVDAFEREYGELDDGLNFDLVTKLPNDCLFVRLTRTANAMLRPSLDHWLLNRAAWLYRRLGRARLLFGT